MPGSTLWSAVVKIGLILIDIDVANLGDAGIYRRVPARFLPGFEVMEDVSDSGARNAG